MWTFFEDFQKPQKTRIFPKNDVKDFQKPQKKMHFFKTPNVEKILKKCQNEGRLAQRCIFDHMSDSEVLQ